MAHQKEVIVVGGGLSGLSATMSLASQGYHVKLISVTKVKRSHSVCAQGGINAAMNLHQENDSPLIHAYDTIKGGDFLADQPPVLEMCLAAPHIIEMMERFGCPFNRTIDGRLDFRRFGGTLYHRTAFCGASTGQQLLYALDEQVRRFESMGRVEKFESHEFMRLILDSEGKACGIVVMDIATLQLFALKASAVVVATGGIGMLFKKSTNSTFCTGAANGRLYQQGMLYANGEFIQIHPTAIPGIDKMRLMSESARGEGGRIWVYGDSSKQITAPDGRVIPCGKTGEPWYFLEELYPAFGNLIPRDIGAREILRIYEMGLGIDGEAAVYLDVTHLPEHKKEKLRAILEIYQKFTQEDPTKVPMKIFPAMHYSMGGAWVDWPAADAPDRCTRYRQMTSLKGCFSIGEADFQYHGANRLGANALLACIFSGLVTGKEISRYIDSLSPSAHSSPSRVFEEAIAQEECFKRDLFARSGSENIYQLYDEMASQMFLHVTAKRNNTDLAATLQKLQTLKERYLHINIKDRSSLANQTYILANQFRPMLALAMVITKSALLRNESRGSHYKPEFPARDDQTWLKTTLAAHQPHDDPSISYTSVDMRHLTPFERDYTKAQKVTPHLENIPDKIELPFS